MDECRLSYRNIFVYEVDAQVVGILIAYNSNHAQRLDLPMINHLRSNGIDVSSFDKECLADEFYIDTVSVDGRFQGRGIATKLFEYAGKVALDLGFKKLSLLVDYDKPKVKSLYKKLGFVDNTTLMVSGSKFFRMVQDL